MARHPLQKEQIHDTQVFPPPVWAPLITHNAAIKRDSLSPFWSLITALMDLARTGGELANDNWPICLLPEAESVYWEATSSPCAGSNKDASHLKSVWAAWNFKKKKKKNIFWLAAPPDSPCDCSTRHLKCQLYDTRLCAAEGWQG